MELNEIDYQEIHNSVTNLEQVRKRFVDLALNMERKERMREAECEVMRQNPRGRALLAVGGGTCSLQDIMALLAEPDGALYRFSYHDWTTGLCLAPVYDNVNQDSSVKTYRFEVDRNCDPFGGFGKWTIEKVVEDDLSADPRAF